MTLHVEFIPAASDEIDEADDWLEERRSGLGLDFINAVDRAARSASAWPNAGQPVDQTSGGATIRRVPVGRFPYYLGYVVRDDTLYVVAVAHERRRPNYWIGRAEPGDETHLTSDHGES